MQAAGATIVPLRLYLTNGRGKEQDAERQMRRAMRRNA